VRGRWRRAAGVLGGKAVLGRTIATPLEAHELLQSGLPGAALHRMMDSLHFLDASLMAEKPLGMSIRTLEMYHHPAKSTW